MNPQIGRLAHDNLTPMAYLTAMPGHVPQWRQYLFDRAALQRPGTLDLDGIKVIMIQMDDPDPLRVYTLGLTLSHAFLTHYLTVVYPLGTFPEITDFAVLQDGTSFLYLLQDCSRELLGHFFCSLQ